MVIHSSNSNYIYRSFGNGHEWSEGTNYASSTGYWERVLYKSTDGGSSWVDISPEADAAGNINEITSIAADPLNPDVIWITYTGYWNNAWQNKKVLKSTDGGLSWTDYSQGLPPFPANSIVSDPNSSIQELYVATDVGVYYRNSNLSQWECFDDGLPNVMIVELEIHPDESFIAAATYGRGVWKSNLHCAEENDLVLSGTLDHGEVYEAINSITSTEQLVVGATPVLYRAGNSITLNPGFYANSSNSLFCTDITSVMACNGSSNIIFEAPDVSDEIANSNLSKDEVGINTAIVETKEGTLTIYPNPSSGTFYIDADLPTGTIKDINILNYTGQVVMKYSDIESKGNMYEIRMEHLEDGIYFLKAQINNQTITKKLSLVK